MVLLALIFLVVVAAIELVPLPDNAVATLEAVTWMIWGVFAFELAVKVYLAPNRRRYLLSHWADVVSVAIPVLRPLRLLRVLAAGTRLWQNASSLLRHHAFSLLGVSSLSAVIIAAILVYAAERQGDGPIQSFADALWWAAATITTVGYGDVYPKTPAGRGVAVGLMLVGISLFGLLTARVAAFFVEGEKDESLAEKLDLIVARLDRIDATTTTNSQQRAPRDLRARPDARSVSTGHAVRRQVVDVAGRR